MLAVKVVVVPAQRVRLAVVVVLLGAGGAGLTNICTSVRAELHPLPLLAATKYDVPPFIAGVLKLVPVASALPPVEFAYHSSVPVPLAVRVVVLPGHMLWLADGVVLVGAVGVGNTVTTIGIRGELQLLLVYAWPT